jgi:catechol 2,3-dioxygenase-like lactoylglutathione lyase family enzyme
MIKGAHFLLYTSDPDADRAFFRDVLGFRAVDAGHGWLIFALPPAELAVHPSSGNFVQRHGDEDLLGAVLYFMCDDVGGMRQSLEGRGVSCSAIRTAEWGSFATVRLPSGGRVGLYQPTHPTAV